MLTRKILELSGYGPACVHLYPVSKKVDGSMMFSSAFITQVVSESETHVDRLAVDMVRSVAFLKNFSIGTALELRDSQLIDACYEQATDTSNVCEYIIELIKRFPEHSLSSIRFAYYCICVIGNTDARAAFINHIESTSNPELINFIRESDVSITAELRRALRPREAPA